MKLRRLRKSRKGRIEIIPMIDVMFFLLATFMFASLAIEKINILPVNLAKGKAVISNIGEQQITFTIDRTDKIYLNKKLITIEEIANIMPILLSKTHNKNIIIAADQDARAGIVAQVMMQARNIGAEQFSIIVQNK